MKRNALTLCKVIAVLAAIVTVLPFALAEEPVGRVGEDYYGNDINAAVLEANQNPRQLNYSTQYWYKRSTSKSFKLPNMKSADMEKERLEGALAATASGEVSTPNPANPDLPQSEQAELEQTRIQLKEKNTSQVLPPSQITELPPDNTSFSPSISYDHLIGRTTATNIVSEGTVVSSELP